MNDDIVHFGSFWVVPRRYPRGLDSLPVFVEARSEHPLESSPPSMGSEHPTAAQLAGLKWHCFKAYWGGWSD